MILLDHPLYECRARDDEDSISEPFQPGCILPDCTATAVPAFETFWCQVCRTLRRSQALREEDRPLIHGGLRECLCVHGVSESYEERDEIPIIQTEEFAERLDEP